MPDKKNKKIFFVALLAVLFGLSVFGTVFVHAFWYSPETEVKIATTPKVALFGNPLRLIIPVLGTNAKVQNVGVNAKGNMATPNNFTDVGWYKYGAAPGTKGSAVLAGHMDNGVALPGVFKHLEDLKEGDDIFIEMENGEELHYAVKDLATYPYDIKVEKVFGENNDRYLKLITCTGQWMQSKRTHDKRLVVTAVQI